jgi:hypothetical protein
VRTVKSKQRNVKDLATILVSDQPIQNIVFRRTHPTQGGSTDSLAAPRLAFTAHLPHLMGVGDWQDEYVALKEEKAQRENMATSFR